MILISVFKALAVASHIALFIALFIPVIKTLTPIRMFVDVFRGGTGTGRTGQTGQIRVQGRLRPDAEIGGLLGGLDAIVFHRTGRYTVVLGTVVLVRLF